MPVKTSSPVEEYRQIQRKLGHLTMDWEPAVWLNTGYPELNQVLGSRERGIPYGRVMEVAGLESQGKSALALTLAALAQRDGAFVLWFDFESSYDEPWAKKRGVDTSNLVVIQPYVGTFSGEKATRLSTAQELCAEGEAVLDKMHKRYPKMLAVVDSVASMLTAGEAESGLEGQNMRTNMELPMFMSKLMRRWIGMAQSYSCLIILINQLRQAPARFGNPWYTPGGNSVRFFSHIRVQLRRVKGGRMLSKGKQIGIQGIITNHKNKAGGLEGSKIGYKLLFDGPLKFVKASDLEGSDE